MGNPVIAIILALFTLTAQAQDVRSLKPEDRNGDYLKQVEMNVAGIAPRVTVNEVIFDKKIVDEMREKFNSYESPYLARQAYQLNGNDDHARYQQSSKDLAEWTVRKLMQYHVENTFQKNVEQGISRESKNSKSESTKGAAKAVMVVSQIRNALQNTTFNIGKETKTAFHYDLPSGVMKVGMTGPIVNTTIDYRLSPIQQALGNVSSGSEKVSVGVSRKLGFIKASTNFHYGLVGEMNYGVNKEIAGPLSAQVNKSHNTRDNSKDETLFRLNFGTNF